MTTAQDVITRGLRLINVPGRGALLSSTDSAAAFETLQDLLNSEAVSSLFQVGIRRHFFGLQGSKSIYSYGPGGELDTNDFEDPAPVRIEDAYIREGSQITDNRQVTNGDFVLSSGWTLGTGWVIANGAATISTGNAGQTLSQTLSLSAGRTYRLKATFTHRGGSVSLRLIQDGSTNIVEQTIMSNGTFEFEATFSGSTSSVEVVAAADSDMDVNSLQVVERGRDFVELPDTQGSDYGVTIIDQKRYNSRFTKGTGGRPYEILYSRTYPLAEIRFDNSAIPGDILVMDVTVNRFTLVNTSSEIPLHPDAIKWLKYKLADEMSGEYGKAISPPQRVIMMEAWHRLTSGNFRRNKLRVDRMLQDRPTFDINRGDP